MAARHELVAGQRMADQNGVRLLRVERAIGHIGYGERLQRAAGIEAERLGKRHRLAGIDAGLGDRTQKAGIRRLCQCSLRRASVRRLGGLAKTRSPLCQIIRQIAPLF